MHPTWIDCFAAYETLGDCSYLVEVIHTSSGRTSWHLHERPLRTNQSREPRLWGWCGETDNRSRFARGVVRVVDVNKGGDRCRIVSVKGDALVAFLELDGYPELASEVF